MRELEHAAQDRLLCGLTAGLYQFVVVCQNGMLSCFDQPSPGEYAPITDQAGNGYEHVVRTFPAKPRAFVETCLPYCLSRSFEDQPKLALIDPSSILDHAFLVGEWLSEQNDNVRSMFTTVTVDIYVSYEDKVLTRKENAVWECRTPKGLLTSRRPVNGTRKSFSAPLASAPAEEVGVAADLALEVLDGLPAEFMRFLWRAVPSQRAYRNSLDPVITTLLQSGGSHTTMEVAQSTFGSDGLTVAQLVTTFQMLRAHVGHELCVPMIGFDHRFLVPRPALAPFSDLLTMSLTVADCQVLFSTYYSQSALTFEEEAWPKNKISRAAIHWLRKRNNLVPLVDLTEDIILELTGTDKTPLSFGDVVRVALTMDQNGIAWAWRDRKPNPTTARRASGEGSQQLVGELARLDNSQLLTAAEKGAMPYRGIDAARLAAADLVKRREEAVIPYADQVRRVCGFHLTEMVLMDFRRFMRARMTQLTAEGEAKLVEEFFQANKKGYSFPAAFENEIKKALVGYALTYFAFVN